MGLHLLLADPSFRSRVGLRSLFSQYDSPVECIDEATTADALRHKLATTPFDLVIAHHSLVPDITILPSEHFILLVNRLDKELFQAARDHGALGYLSDHAPDTLFQAILSLQPGDLLLDPAFGRQALNGTEQIQLLDALTPREQEIVTLRESGLSLQDIADKLCITKGTVKRHQASARRKQRREGG